MPGLRSFVDMCTNIERLFPGYQLDLRPNDATAILRGQIVDGIGYETDLDIELMQQVASARGANGGSYRAIPPGDCGSGQPCRDQYPGRAAPSTMSLQCNGFALKGLHRSAAVPISIRVSFDCATFVVDDTPWPREPGSAPAH